MTTDTESAIMVVGCTLDHPTCGYDHSVAADLPDSELVTYHYATHFCHFSLRTLRREISRGVIPVISPPSGRAKGHIEVRELRAWLETHRRAAHRRADHKRRRYTQKHARKRS